MFFQHVYDKSLAQGSYVIGCQATGDAIVIDAKRDVDTYLDIARNNKLTITHIAETHIHADFLCGSRELAALTGATMYLSDEGGPDWQYQFPHQGLKDGDVIRVGNLTLKVLHTPGHTPESISFLLTDHPASVEPVMLLTGDFVFVGDIGRPDLLEKAAGLKGTKEIGAHQMYDSLQEFSKLPDHIQVWPAHGAGSACGKALGAVASSTVGYEKIRNWAFSYASDEKGFTEYLLADQPEAPRYFAQMKRLNKEERALLTEVPKHPELSKEAFLKTHSDGVKIIDTRDKKSFAGGFISGSLNIQNNNSLATWAGWMLNYEEPFILICAKDELEEVTRKLMRIGLDKAMGYLPDVTKSGLPLQKANTLSLEEFKNYIGRVDVQIIDVRGETEYAEGHIPEAENLFVGTLPQNLDRIRRDKELVIHCQSGDRSALAQSILAANGFKDVKNFSGGMKGWKEAGEKTISSRKTEPENA